MSRFLTQLGLTTCALAAGPGGPGGPGGPEVRACFGRRRANLSEGCSDAIRSSEAHRAPAPESR